MNDCGVCSPQDERDSQRSERYEMVAYIASYERDESGELLHIDNKIGQFNKVVVAPGALATSAEVFMSPPKTSRIAYTQNMRTSPA